MIDIQKLMSDAASHGISVGIGFGNPGLGPNKLEVHMMRIGEPSTLMKKVIDISKIAEGDSLDAILKDGMDLVKSYAFDQTYYS